MEEQIFLPAGTSEWSSQKHNQTETLQPNQKMTSLLYFSSNSQKARIQTNSPLSSNYLKQLGTTFSYKEVTEYSLQISIIWLVIKTQRTTVMEVGRKFCRITATQCLKGATHHQSHSEGENCRNISIKQVCEVSRHLNRCRNFFFTNPLILLFFISCF